MITVYAVSSGTYSDYRINAIFSTREKACNFMATLVKPEYEHYNEIEEYELDPPADDLIKRGYSVWYIQMLKDGTTEIAEEATNVCDISRIDKPEIAYYAAPRGDSMNVFMLYVWAKTKEQAIKIVNEKRVQMIADGTFN